MITTAFDISRLPRIAPPRDPGQNVIETRRLTLRVPDENDMVAMTALADNRNVSSRAWNMPQPYTIADAGRFLRRARDPDAGLAAFAVMFRETDTFLGCVKIETGDDDSDRQLGFWLGEPHWNRGYMTEALQAVADNAFARTPRLARITASVHVNNPASRRVLEKCGFQYAGPSTETDRHGRLAPADRYAIDRGIWNALKTWAHRH